MFLVDTDVLSALAKRRPNVHVANWVASQRSTDLFVSVISIGEIERGIELQRGINPDFAAMLGGWLDHILSIYRDRVVSFDLAAARRWGQLSAEIGHSGTDLQIAATALECGLAVVTRNVMHFEPTGVAVINPFLSRKEE